MTLIEVACLNFTERMCHQRYWHYMLDAMGEKVSDCPTCGKSFLEEPRIWTEADEMPEARKDPADDRPNPA